MKSVFSFYDDKACFFLAPVVIENFASLARSIRAAAAENADAPFVRYPSDFIVYEIGSFDEETGLLSGFDIPNRISSVAEILAQSST